MSKFAPVTSAPAGFVPVSEDEVGKLIVTNRPNYKKWHLVRFDYMGCSCVNVFDEASGDLISVDTRSGCFASPKLFAQEVEA